jgi:hypothetical protein
LRKSVLCFLFVLFATPIVMAQDGERVDRLQQVRDKLGINLNGFLDYRVGQRLQHDDHADDDILNEARFQLDLSKDIKEVTLRIRADLLYDALDEDASDIDLERGDGWLDLREANAMFSPTDWMDVKIGRQILTWGTGEYLFVNDLFPKDWVSFFNGRDQEYLKAPSDALFVSMFPGWADIYIAYTPRFDPDRYITGESISYYNALAGTRAGDDAIQNPSVQNDWFKDDEIAIRIAKNVGSYELSGYFYDGYWKSPGGMDLTTMRGIFPDLRVYGASARGTLGKGIANVEIGWYESRNDKDGDDPFINNSEFRFLVGYQREMGRDLTLGLQYYLEYMNDYGDYKRTLPAGMKARDHDRHVTTISLTKLLMSQNLRLSLFAYYSPSDHDVFIRPSANYKINDSWQASIGANIFAGKYEHTFFGQFEHNSNVYVSARYSF